MVKQDPKEKKVIYLDSCVILDHISLARGHTSVNGNKKFDIGTIDPEKAEVIISNINIIEVSEKLRDSKASEIALSEGYSYFELNKQRIDKIVLNDKQIKKIDDEIQAVVLNLPAVAAIDPKGFSAEEIGALTEFCLNHSMFMIDAMHFMIADREGCDFFVTSDNGLYNAIRNFVKKEDATDSINIETAKSFKNNKLAKFIK